MRTHFKISEKTLLVIAGALAVLLSVPNARSQGGAGLPNPATVVKPQAYVSSEPVAKGKEFQIAVVVDIARGFHMNSHKPTDEYLIPTSLTAQLPAGFQLADTVYPEGKLEKFSFSPNKALDVYTNRVTLKMRVMAQGNAALGPATIPLTLRYQACNDAACLPPVRVPVMVPVTIAAAGTKTQPAHPEVFSATDKKS
jgi:DsbC/DsbD-like thiol-disulfide interchange protein